MKRASLWAWLWIGLGVVYFFLPLVATFDFSLRSVRDVLSVTAYQQVFSDPRFYATFNFSLLMAAATMVTSMVLLLPTAFWVHWRLPHLRPVMEIVSILPFVIPAVVLVFGLIRIYSRQPFVLVGSPALLVASYVILSLPYTYRAIDVGLSTIDVRTLTEAALSLGAGWLTILLRVILPNVRVALLSGSFLSFAIVMGEFTFASLLNWPAFGPYMVLVGRSRPYQAAALALISFALSWGAIGLIQWFSRRAPGQGQVAGTR